MSEEIECTTISVRKETRERLARIKEFPRESYDDTINKLITLSDKLGSAEEGELNEETLRDISIAREQAKRGKAMSTKELIARLGL